MRLLRAAKPNKDRFYGTFFDKDDTDEAGYPSYRGEVPLRQRNKPGMPAVLIDSTTFAGRAGSRNASTTTARSARANLSASRAELLLQSLPDSRKKSLPKLSAAPGLSITIPANPPPAPPPPSARDYELSALAAQSRDVVQRMVHRSNYQNFSMSPVKASQQPCKTGVGGCSGDAQMDSTQGATHHASVLATL